MNLCSKIIMIQTDNPVSEFKTRKFIAYLGKARLSEYKDRCICAINNVNSPEQDKEGFEDIYNKSLKRIYIEKDENSFRLTLNHLDININHTFGVGIKKGEEVKYCHRKGGNKMYGELCSVKEITEGVRAVINSKQEQLTDAEVLALIEDYVLRDRRTGSCSFRAKGELISGIFNTTRKDLDILQPYADDKEVSEIMVKQ